MNPAVRALVVSRAGGVCERCGAAWAAHVHHRKLRSQGGSDSPANLAALCLPCHGWCHAHPADAVADGWIVRSYGDPETVAVRVLLSPVLLAADGAYYLLPVEATS